MIKIKNSFETEKLSLKGEELIGHYKEMVEKGYYRKDGKHITDTYESFELKKFKEVVLEQFNLFKIKTLLDYGGGGSDWEKKGFYLGKSAKEYFNLDKIINFEPARLKNNIDICDAVICFDVLEHIYFNDLNYVLNNIYSNAKKIVVLQIACYEASAILPSGENAHITVRPPLWWKGFIDSFAIKFPDISTMLFCSTSYNKAHLFKIQKSEDYNKNKKYTVKLE